MKIIRLRHGEKAIVDDVDFEFLSQFPWSKNCNGYAVRNFRDKNGKNRYWLMHRLIAKTSFGKFTDHVNLHKLDNRKENLRIASKSQNSANTRIRKNSKTGFKGVSHHPDSHRVRARITVNGKERHLGMFDTPKLAWIAYQTAAQKTFGEYARAT